MRSIHAIVIAAVVTVAAPAGADPVKYHVVTEGGHRRIVIETPIDITGRAPAPAVAVLTPALQIDYQWPASIDSFVPLIVASVRAAVFASPAGQVRP